MRVVLALILFVAVASAIPQTKVHINCSPDPAMNSKYVLRFFLSTQSQRSNSLLNFVSNLEFFVESSEQLLF